MVIIDSHCHIDKLDLNAFGGSVESMLAHAKGFSVEKFLCVCINLEDFDKVHSLAKKYTQIYASVGVHPNEENVHDPSVNELLAFARDDNIVAIGETGLDYFRLDKNNTPWQRERFARHIDASNISNKPLIIHSRNARDDTLGVMKESGAKRGVMHCFTEDYKMAKAAIDLGFYISFSGIVTFKNAQELQAVAKKIPLDAMLVETDAPYLTPTPYRGKPNSPAYTYFVVKEIAHLHKITPEKVAEITTKNFNTLFLNVS